MTDEAMSPLRRRMIEDMTIRKLARKTQQDYIQIIKKLAAFLGRSPDTATFEDLRRFQLHVVASGVGTSSAGSLAISRPKNGSGDTGRYSRSFGLSAPFASPPCGE